MAEQSVPVLPGQVSTLAVAMAAGTTIYNGDPANAVWISGNPTPGPGSGMRIGPKGSLSWTDAGSPVFAAADAGVTTTTILTLSGAVAALVNPVDVGAAVAAQLLAQGVPSVLIGDTVVDQYEIPVPPSPALPWFLPADVGKYASLTLYFKTTKAQRVTMSWADTESSYIAPGRTVILAGVPAGAPATLSITTAVKGARLALFFTDPTGIISVTAYASNRALPDAVIVPEPFYQSQISSRAWGAFATVSFPDAFTTAGGLHNVRGNANLSGQKGYLVLSLLTAAGAAVDVPILDSGSGTIGPAGEAIMGGTAILPAGRYYPRWQNAGTAGTFAPLLTIVPTP